MFYAPTRALRITLAGAWRRYRCGRRFGHFRGEDESGYPTCLRCGCPLM